MTEDEFGLSRRKVLGALGAVGVASAGAGIGTSALFSDQETFENNRLVAGELDLLMDWEEHYSFVQQYGRDDPLTENGEPLDVRDTPDDDYRAFPIGLDEGQEALFYLNEGDVPEYMTNTSIEAFPDTDNDGVANLFDLVGFPGRIDTDGSEPCEVLADVGGESDGLAEYADPGTDTSGRTRNADTYDEEAKEVLPLINLDDVKPGDFGEVTFSLHLCDNDGYIWMNAANVVSDENGVMEPEAGVDQQEIVELLDEIRVAAWYDNNCDNLIDEEPGEADVMLVVDTSGSISSDQQTNLINATDEFIEALPTDGSVQLGFVTFGGNDVEITDTLGPVSNFLSGGSGDAGSRLTSFGGNTPMPAALEAAEAELESSGARPDAEKYIVLVTDGGPNYDPDVPYSVTTSDGTVSLGSYSGGDTTPGSTIHDSEIDETVGIAEGIEAGGIDILSVGVLAQSEEEVTNPGGTVNLNGVLIQIAGAAEDFYNTEFGPDLIAVEQAIADRIVGGDEVFLRGTLREALDLLTDGDGIPLDAARDSPFDEVNDPANDPDRQPFDASATYCVGFSWWLPVGTGNEVQSDTVGFDIGFYTEQARNNDGSGQPVA
ncbi:VWA domain-containing protein [Halobellus sp. Atlit-31R]|nr:VWA domain-containing protein [Halobellus sp. Atlit-31R]